MAVVLVETKLSREWQRLGRGARFIATSDGRKKKVELTFTNLADGEDENNPPVPAEDAVFLVFEPPGTYEDGVSNYLVWARACENDLNVTLAHMPAR